MAYIPNQSYRIYVDFIPTSLSRRLSAGVAATALVAAGVPALFASPAFSKPAAGGKQEILLVSYAVTKTAYDKIIPLFQADWKKKTGQTVTVKTSYGGSGSQSRAVIDGLEADVVGLALEGDVIKIQEACLIDKGWQKENPNNSTITNSVVVFFVRPGNPKKINTWKDLDNKDVDVVTANPKTSGGARWNFLSLYGSVTQTGGSDAQAKNI